MTPLLWVTLLAGSVATIWLARPLWQRRSAQVRFDDMTRTAPRRLPVLTIGMLVASMVVLFVMTYTPDSATLPTAATKLAAKSLLPGSVPVPPSALGDQALVRAEARVTAIVDSLAQRLVKRPGDVDGWHTLALSYAALGRHDRAVETFGKALRLRPDEPTMLAEYAFSLAARDPSASSGEPARLIARALQLDPHNPKALQVAGTLAIHGEGYSTAANHWAPLVQMEPTHNAAGKQAFGVKPLAPMR